MNQKTENILSGVALSLAILGVMCVILQRMMEKKPDGVVMLDKTGTLTGHMAVELDAKKPYLFDTSSITEFAPKTNEIDFGDTTVFTLNVHNFSDKYTNLLQLLVDDVPIVTVKVSGEVVYDTNKVSEATRVFWREMTYHARKVAERIKP